MFRKWMSALAAWLEAIRMPALVPCSVCAEPTEAGELTDGYCWHCHATFGPDLDMRDFEADARAAEDALDAARDR